MNSDKHNVNKRKTYYKGFIHSGGELNETNIKEAAQNYCDTVNLGGVVDETKIGASDGFWTHIMFSTVEKVKL